MKFLAVRVPKNNEYTYEQSQALFSSLIGGSKKTGLASLLQKIQNKEDNHPSYSFNILAAKQRIHFIIVTRDENEEMIKNQILGQYSNADVLTVPPFKFKTPYFYELVLAKNNFFPIRTIDQFTGIDPLASVLTAISRSNDPNAVFWVQIVIEPIGSSWQNKALALIDSLGKVPEGGSQSQLNRNQISAIQQKIQHQGFNAYIRILSNNQVNLNLLVSSFNIYALASGNSLITKETGIFKKEKLAEAINNHKPYGTPSILNTFELSTLWHMPNNTVAIPNIVWGKRLTLEAPENLPIATNFSSDEDKQKLTFIGRTEFKNNQAVFGIEKEDRLKHMYIVGKTGTGKSTLIANLAIDDIRKGEGVAVLDPHGDLIQHILDYIPKKRIKDVCYFNPADPEYSYPLNILDVPSPSQKELMVSGIISIFYKIYGNSWGPRLEYILRNVLFTLVNTPDTTLADVLKILLDKNYRTKVVEKLDDPILIQFWQKEFEKMAPAQLSEAINPILNKVGQFVTSPLIRKIISHKKSKVKVEEIMNSGKILLCDLSQGKIGEDNATLLGSMLITQIQIASMNRVYQSESERKPFFLYVDEFQNFATTSFIKILSESRKYKLALTLANQYINQIDPAIINAIFGNVGTLMALTVGAGDGEILSREFGNSVTPEDLSMLERFQMVMRLSIQNQTSAPFQAYSLPLPKNISGHNQKIIESSRRNFGVKITPQATKTSPEVQIHAQKSLN